MNKRAIQYIVGLMSLALIGIAIIQFYWIKWSVDLNAKNFDDKVILALNRVHQRLLEDAKSKESAMKFINEANRNGGFLKKDIDPLTEILSPGYETWQIKSILVDEIADIQLLFNPSLALEIIEPAKLNNYIQQELLNQGIKLNYDYGIYSTASKSFTIINGNHVVVFDEDPQASEIDINRGLYNTNYEIRLFPSANENIPGYLKIFFPNKTTYLWSSVWPSMLSSILFTGLILFCFIYTINIILRQKKVSEMKNDFINNMTHEFKTPIATISLAVDSITSPMVLHSIDKIKKFAHIIKQENGRMLSQVEKVLQMALLDKQDFTLKLTDLDVHNVITQAAEYANLKVQRNNGVVQTVLQARNPVIEADMTHVSNVVHNLLDNAVKYSVEKPKITIFTRNVSNGIEVKVEDNGIGMNKEELKHIFDKFYRVHTGNLHDIKGFGLGLSYVKAIMNAHHGTIDVISEPGEGSIFTLVFPFKVSEN